MHPSESKYGQSLRNYKEVMRIEKKGFMEFLQYNNIEGGIGNKGQGQEE